MKASEFAKAVREMLQAEKEMFQGFLENEDWDGLEDEIFEYASNCDGD